MREFRIAVFPGDGIGPEIMAPCITMLTAIAARIGTFKLNFEPYEAGAGLYKRTGVALPESAMAAARSADAILLGAMGLPNVRYPSGTEVQPHLDMREALELYSGVRPIRIIPGTPTPLADPRATTVDCVLVRESTEGLFFCRNMTRQDEDAVYDTMRISRGVSERLFEFAFSLARSRSRVRKNRPARVTCVDKANVIPSLAYFRYIFLEVAKRHSDILSDCAYVDATALRLVREPWEFDVLVTENMFGDILSDLGAALIGGMGMAPSADIGDKHAIFQPCHGTAPDIAGRGLANPTAMILSAAMMLDWLGDRHAVSGCNVAASIIRRSVEEAFSQGTLVSTENGGAAGTDAIMKQINGAMMRELGAGVLAV